MINFDDILGQDTAIAALRQAYAADRLPHGLIFAGPQGVGKATTAAALAGLFLCEKPKGGSACGKCESCRVLAADTHPDYHVIHKELIRVVEGKAELKPTEISVKVLRPMVVEKANNKAVMGRGKVFIIERADLMNAEGQNVLLKTLEEPPGRTLIILLTDQPDALLATVRSRCRLVWFAALDEKVVARELVKRGIDKDLAADAARLSEGSLGLALMWIEDGVIAPARDLIGQVQSILAGQPPGDLRQWFKSAADAYVKKQLDRDEHASERQAARDGLLLYLRFMTQEFRARLRQTTDPEQMERLCALVDAVMQAETYIDANVTISVIFQQLSLKLANSQA